MKNQIHPRRRGMTMVEMLIALVIISIVSVAVFSVVSAAGHTDQFLRNETQALSEAEITYHRILANTRACTATPTITAAASSGITNCAAGTYVLTLAVPDIASNTTKTVKYYCVGTSSPYTLYEDDPRYNPSSGTPAANILAHNVSAFTITAMSSPATGITLDMTVKPPQGAPIRRHVNIDCRNF